MKFYKIIGFSAAFLLIFSSSLNVFGNSMSTFVSSDGYGQIDTLNTNIISFNSSGEVISNLSKVTSLYQISSSEKNTLIKQYAKIVSDNAEKTIIPVYSSPANPGNVIGQISVGSIILIDERVGGFVKILYKESFGYIEDRYIKTTGEIEKEEVNLEPAKPEETTPTAPTTQATPQAKYAKVTAETGLNLREEPSTSSKVLKLLPCNTYTTILEIQQNWIKVKTGDNQTGYISAEYAIITDKIEQQVASVSAQNIIDFAKQHLGKPYIYGGTNLNVGTDCSGFTYAVFKHFGINLNRSSRDQYLNGKPVEKSNLLPGDLVFFNTGGNTAISHVGLYIGNNQYIHCTDSKNQGVIISSLGSDYGLKTYYGARRIL
ncbi:MAG: C40 family peptidase [Eubacteriales bacterium]|nr:C40 family peptidase [Eubacteriales bacterium]